MLDRIIDSKATPKLVLIFSVIVPVLVLSLLGFEQRLNLLVILCALLGLAPVLMFHVYRRDIKERNDVEKALRESESRYRLLIEHSPNAIGVHENGRILYTNRAWAKLLGASDPNEVVGKRILEFFRPDSQNQMESMLGQQARRDGLPVEQRLIRNDGTPLDVEISAVALLNDGNETVQIVIRDITESKHAAEKMSTALRLAQQATQLKSEFLANMSHELRTPMNGVLGMVDVLLTTSLTDEQREYAQIIHTSATGLMSVLNDVLDVSRIEAGRIEFESAPFDLRQLVTEVINLYSARADAKDLTILSSCDDRVPQKVSGDSSRIRQVLNNLVDNAIKFTEKGEISVTVECRSTSDGVAKLHFVVQDSGIGIPAEKHSVIFEKFEQVDATMTRKYGGAGLGLAICQQIVHLLGGKIGVHSTPSKGSRFWFTLELPTVHADSPVTAPEELNEITGEARVLVVEDNEINRVVVCRMLEKLGYQVEVAKDGKEAIEKIGKDRFALVLMDINLPLMDGFEATRQIRMMEGKAEHLPIIAVTAHAMRDDRQRCLSAGMDDYVSKPIDIANLAKAVTTWTGQNVRDTGALRNPAGSPNHASPLKKVDFSRSDTFMAVNRDI